MIKPRTPEEIQARDLDADRMLRLAKMRARSKNWYRNPENKARQRINDRRRRGMPEPTRPCPAVCECCGQPPSSRGMHLDHDHVTGEFRGWLCSNCNTGIGKLGDSVIGLLRAIAYLIWAAQ